MSDDFHRLAVNIAAAANKLVSRTFDGPILHPSKSHNKFAHFCPRMSWEMLRISFQNCMSFLQLHHMCIKSVPFLWHLQHFPSSTGHKISALYCDGHNSAAPPHAEAVDFTVSRCWRHPVGEDLLPTGYAYVASRNYLVVKQHACKPWLNLTMVRIKLSVNAHSFFLTRD